jgi:hypothetical protein
MKRWTVTVLFLCAVNITCAQPLYLYHTKTLKSWPLHNDMLLYIKVSQQSIEHKWVLLGADSSHLYFQSDTVLLANVQSIRFHKKENFKRLCLLTALPVLGFSAWFSLAEHVPFPLALSVLGSWFYTPVLVGGVATHFELYEPGKNARFIYQP